MKKRLLAASLLLACSAVYADSGYTVEELGKLKAAGLISEYDYEILLSETLGYHVDGKYIYDLTVDRFSKDRNYTVIKKEGKEYYPVLQFFKIIGFINYQQNEKNLKFFLGKEIAPVILDISSQNQSIITDGSEIYLESEEFKKLFLSELSINEDDYLIRMWTSFETPREIELHLNNTFDDQYYRENSGALFFTNSHHLFDLGYARLDFGAGAKRDMDAENDDFTKQWYARTEYQGSLLYGELTASYDFKEHRVGDVYLQYPEIWRQHTLELGSYSYGNKARENGFIFQKERGYYIEGKRYIIRENVPIGSRVELLYLGFPIDVKRSEDGLVEFDNPEIRADRNYRLRVYTAEGQIYVIDVNTTSDYHQQNKGEVEYDIQLREDHETGKSQFEGNVYYGITENLTLGGGFIREPEEEDDEVQYYEAVRGEAVYSNFVYRNPYTLVLGGEKAVNDNDKAPRYSYDVTGQLDVRDFTFIGELRRKGKYYDTKDERRIALEYNPVNYLQLDSNYYHWEYYDGGSENDYDIGLSLYGGIKDLLITGEASRYKNDGHEYGVNFYYTGLHAVNLKLNNRWMNDGKDYETTFTIFNKNIWDIVDFDVEFSYSKQDRDMFTFRFTLDYDNWFKTDIYADKDANQNYTVGIDRVIDLKNIRKPIESMNSSRVRAVTFLDANGNNSYDPGEKLVDNVKISIGGEKGVTDANGEVILYGIPNNVLHDLKPVIRKPSYMLAVDKISVRGKSSGTIDVYIPLKQMITLTGMLEIPKSIKVKENEKTAFYEDIFVKITDEDENVLEISMLDDNGEFHVSGLQPGRTYMAEFQSIEKYKPFRVLYRVKPGSDIRGINEVKFAVE